MSHRPIELRTDDGTCPAHVFTPDGVGPWPGVLLYMDGLGLRPAILAIAARAAAAYHPGGLATDAPDSPHLLAPHIQAEVYVAGASDDSNFPAEQKQRLEQALTAAGVRHTVETYPARHGWVPTDTPVHDPAAA